MFKNKIYCKCILVTMDKFERLASRFDRFTHIFALQLRTIPFLLIRTHKRSHLNEIRKISTRMKEFC